MTMDPNPVSARDLADPLARPDLPSPTVAAHPLPTLGETVVHDGRYFVVRDVHVSTKSYANPGGPERVMLNLRLTAWEGEAPYEDPANASMY